MKVKIQDGMEYSGTEREVQQEVVMEELKNVVSGGGERDRVKGGPSVSTAGGLTAADLATRASVQLPSPTPRSDSSFGVLPHLPRLCTHSCTST